MLAIDRTRDQIVDEYYAMPSKAVEKYNNRYNKHWRRAGKFFDAVFCAVCIVEERAKE